MFRLWGFLAHISQLTATLTWLFTPRGFPLGFAACKPRACCFDANSFPAASECGACNFLLVYFNHVISPKLRSSLLSWRDAQRCAPQPAWEAHSQFPMEGRDADPLYSACCSMPSLALVHPFLSESFFKPIMWIFPPSPSLSVIPARSHKVAVLLLVHHCVACYLFSTVNICV